MSEKKYIRSVSVGTPEFIEDKDERIIELAFSSESPYTRTYYDDNDNPIELQEVLVHDESAVDLSILNETNASLLFNHKMDLHLGKIVPNSARIDSDRVGRCLVQFSRVGNLANEVYEKVKEKTLSQVSVGYSILEGKADFQSGIYYVTRWQPYEVSIVTCGADPFGAGVGRSLNKDIDGSEKEEPENVEDSSLEEKRMSDNKRSEEELLQEIEQLKADLEAERAKREEAEHQPEEKEEEQQEQEQAQEEKQEENPEEFQRSEEEIEEMKEIAEHVGMEEEELQEHIEDEAMDLERFKRFALNKYTRKSEKVNQKGKETMNMKEVNAHDTIRSILTGKELSAEAKAYHDAKVMNAERSGHEVRGTFIPVNALARASQNVASVSKIQQTEVRYDSFVDLLMAESILGKLNCNRLVGLTTPISIPRVKTVNEGVFGWVSEDGEAPESTATFDAVPMMPKQFVGGIPVSKLALQTTPGITGLVSDLLIRHASQKLEQCLFTNKAVGNGTNAPKGLVEAIAKSDVEFTYASFVAEIAKLTDKGVPASALRFVMRGEMASTLKTTLKDAGVQGYILENGMIAGVPVVESGNVDANSIYLGDFSAITIGEWGDLSLDLDDTTRRNAGQIIARVWASLDIAVTNPDAIVRLEKKSQ